VSIIGACAAVQLLCDAAGQPARAVLTGAPHFTLTVTLRSESDLRGWHARFVDMTGREDHEPVPVRRRLLRSHLTWRGWSVQLQYLAAASAAASPIPSQPGQPEQARLRPTDLPAAQGVLR
jgi:hypothetical protein